MATAASLRTSLAGIVGADSLAPDGELGRYAVEGLVPRAVAFPHSQEQVAAVVDLAARERLAVAPRGSGSLMALGGVPERLDIVLGLDRLSSPIEHAAGDMTVTVGAGSTLAALQQTLAEEGQWLPLDPPLASQRTLGGILATNLAGPLSLAYGTVRDMVLGMKVASADGIVTKSGGKVVKNVTGFDITKAHLGAFGTLGVIVEASLRVAPLPSKDFTLLAVFESLGDAVAASLDLVSHSFAPQAVEIAMIGLNRGSAYGGGEQPGSLVYARFLGTSSGMERRLEEGSTRLWEAGADNVDVVGGDVVAQTWRWLADFGWDPQAGQGLLLRLGCLPSRTRQVATAVVGLVQPQGYEMSLVAGPGRGVVRCFLPGEAWLDVATTRAMVEGVRGLAAPVGGYAVVERCRGQMKAHLDVWGDPGEGMALMRRLKEQMDPDRILNPGRFVGGI